MEEEMKIITLMLVMLTSSVGAFARPNDCAMNPYRPPELLVRFCGGPNNGYAMASVSPNTPESGIPRAMQLLRAKIERAGCSITDQRMQNLGIYRFNCGGSERMLQVVHKFQCNGVNAACDMPIRTSNVETEAAPAAIGTAVVN